MKATTVIVGVICLFTTGKFASKHIFGCYSKYFCHAVLANGEFSILHSPNGINFRGDEQLNTSELPKIISTAMGHTIPSVSISLILVIIKEKLELPLCLTNIALK